MFVLATLCSLLQIAGAQGTQEKGQIRGVEPSKLEAYRYWKGCLDGSNTKAVLNDDFCDCVDGSDEPSTTACYNGTFYCQNEGHVPSFIKSMQVDDGFCDPACCDGTDEKSGFCPNICKEHAIKKAKDADETERVRKLGAKAKLALYLKAKEIYTEQLFKSKQLEASLTSLNADVTSKRKALKELKKKAAGGVSGIGGIVSDLMNSVMEIVVGPPDESLSTDPTPNESLEQCSSEGDSSSCSPGLQEAISAAKTDLREAKRKIREAKESIKELSESMKNAPKGQDEVYSALKNTCLEYQESSYTYKYCWFKEIKQNYMLLGKFDEKSWNIKDGRMKFEDGEKCYNGPIRHVIVQLVCSPEEKIISIAEPNMCEYFMEIGTSSFCDIAVLENAEL